MRPVVYQYQRIHRHHIGQVLLVVKIVARLAAQEAGPTHIVRSLRATTLGMLEVLLQGLEL